MLMLLWVLLCRIEDDELSQVKSKQQRKVTALRKMLRDNAHSTTTSTSTTRITSKWESYMNLYQQCEGISGVHEACFSHSGYQMEKNWVHVLAQKTAKPNIAGIIAGVALHVITQMIKKELITLAIISAKIRAAKQSCWKSSTAVDVQRGPCCCFCCSCCSCWRCCCCFNWIMWCRTSDK